ncbi:hypothetical protein [Tellurirhabdus bombi]|uniref:hypothetical protein n=1 Tax=Tellurirhabdus bombi TaxID=2907205 RepID=UPI001F488BF9|nr:hypothetical protein [Tellurirhabdus bombi]
MAKALTTDLALKRLLTSEEYLATWLRCGYTLAHRRTYLHRLVKGTLSTGKKEEILIKAGFSVKMPTTWNRPLK